MSCKTREMEVDRISNLPNEVIEDILSRLPLEEATKTSVLSSQWRYKSAMLRHLKFDNQLHLPKHTALKETVDHVLLLHIGPIHTFKLSRKEFIATSVIDRWIFHVSRNSIKYLILIWEGPYYKMPSCLFSCPHLVHLGLYRCLLTTPPTFKGFRSLKSLNFRAVRLVQDELEHMIACSPQLERLILTDFIGFMNLKIDAPNLRFLRVEGDFQDFTCENTLNNLADVEIGLEDSNDDHQRMVPNGSSNLIKFFEHLPHIRKLTIKIYFLKYLSLGAVPEKLPTPYPHLKFLSMRIHFNNPKEILTALCLLRSSPALQKLEISAQKNDPHLQVEEARSLDPDENALFVQLRLVEITGISSGVKSELDLIRLLLSNSPVLKKMTIKPASANGSHELVKELIRFRRASAYAEILYLDP